MVRLLDDEELRRAAGGWEAPPLELRETLHPHDIVKLLFVTPDRVGAEAMWVEILSARPWRYEGILLSEPIWLRDVEQGERIVFEPRHVTDVLPPGSKSWRPGMGASVWDPFRPEGEKEGQEEPKEPQYPKEISFPERAAPHREPLPTPEVFYLPYLGPVAEHPPPKPKWYEAFGPKPPPEEREIIVRPGTEMAPGEPPPTQLPAKPIPKVFEIFKPAEPAPAPPGAPPPPPKKDWVEAVLPEKERAALEPEEKPEDIWDALVPEAAKEEAPELAPEELFAPEEEKKKKRARKKKKIKEPPAPRLPSEEAILEGLNDRFELQLMAEDVVAHREDPYFQKAVESSAVTGEAAILPLARLVRMTDPEWILEYGTLLGGRLEEWEPWLDYVLKSPDPEEAWETFTEKAFEPLTSRAIGALRRITPKQVPGKLIIDTSFDEVMLGYFEAPTEEMIEALREKVASHEAKASKEYEKRRQRLEKKLKKWKPPTAKDIEALVDDLDVEEFIDRIKRERKKAYWKRDLKERGEAAIELERITRADENILWDLVSFLGLPREVAEAYEEEKLYPDFWKEVFVPAAELLEDEFRARLPKSVPGTLGIRKMPNETLVLVYIESAR